MDVSLVPVVLKGLFDTAKSGIDLFKTFREQNSKRLAKGLQEAENSGIDFSSLADNEENQRYIVGIIENALQEVNIEKVDAWKNAIISFATDFEDFDYKDSFVRTLETLTVYELTVLYRIYASSFSETTSEEIVFFRESEVIRAMYPNFDGGEQNIEGNMVAQATRQLASHHLITEMTFVAAILDGEPSLKSPPYTKNELGRRFIEFIRDYGNEEPSME